MTLNNPPVLSEAAPAKINLDLRITGRRADGYHLLDSLVVFADYGDRLNFRPGPGLSLTVEGPFGAALSGSGDGDDNLVLRAARAFSRASGMPLTGHFTLVKNLPVASGLGGGSADAAATLRIAKRLYPDALPQQAYLDLALELGADVPACFTGGALRMCGIGEKITPVRLDFPVFLLLVNPGVAVSTAAIFAEQARSGTSFSDPRDLPDMMTDQAKFLSLLRMSGNDLEAAACRLEPAIRDLLVELQALEGCLLARMSGSGATCFALLKSREAVRTAEEKMAAGSPRRWIRTVGVK